MALAETRGSSKAAMLRSPRFLLLAFVLFGAFAFFLIRPHPIDSITQVTASNRDPSKPPAAALLRGKPPLGSSADATNSTLGFERVFVINLPERYDKLDAFSLAASLTGFTHDVIEGIKGSSIGNKTLPTLENLPKVTNLFLVAGSVIRIVRDRLSSALVLEDDSDWDVSLKDQLADIATGSRYISGTPTPPRSPYGDEWDLLWLGHCSAQQDPADPRQFVIENDNSVPPPQHRVNFNRVPELHDNSTRIVYKANNGVCLYSYALSYRGAQKVLRWQNNVKEFNPIDMGIGYQCRDDPNFKCIAVYPQVVDSHKGAGRQSRDSDIGAFDPNSIREKGFTHNIARSTRLNVENLMHGGAVENQWADQPTLSGPRRTRFSHDHEFTLTSKPKRSYHPFPQQIPFTSPHNKNNMHSTSFAPLALAALVATSASVSATRLFASSYAGTITTLDLSKVGNASYTLAKLDTNNACAPNASWLQIDVKHRNLFCLDEGMAIGNGSLTSLKINDKTLTPVKHTIIPNAPVHCALFTGSNATQLLAVAHYAWAVTTWKVDPVTAAYTPLQHFNFTMMKPGPNAERQAASHPHQVLVDPMNKFLVVPDLGADLIRIFYIDPKTLQVTPRPSINVTAGSGPRHGVFHSSPDKKAVHYYLLGELSSTLTAYSVSYLPNNGGLQMIPYAIGPATGPANASAFAGNAPSEILLAPPLANGDAQLLVSNRNATAGFPSIPNPDPKNATAIASDSLASFIVPANSATGKDLGFQRLSPAGGSYPRHFSVNKKGDLVAVGLQNSGRVVIYERCVKTGMVRDKPVADIEGLGAVTNVVWDEGEGAEAQTGKKGEMMPSAKPVVSVAPQMSMSSSMAPVASSTAAAPAASAAAAAAPAGDSPVEITA
ncbi:MAG: hypothetical protein Q9206_006214 [Seirophora lacunosa]